MKVPAIKVEQPLGEFYVVALSAEVLLTVCHSVKTEILNDEDDDSAEGPLGKLVDRIKGTQRERKLSRLESIREYSETVDACFPNSVILGANFDESGALVSKEHLRWHVEGDSEQGFTMHIPSPEKFASIIDGQHRVFGFVNSENIKMELLCSVFIDLPMAFQAQIFTKINTTQKRVDKNIAYNLFQFDMEQGSSETWGPETLSVYFARVLSSDNASPFKGLLKLGVSGASSETTISMASIIDGVLSLISSNPDRDRNALHMKSVDAGRDRAMLLEIKSSGPLRDLYLNNKDKTLFNILIAYFVAVKAILWKDADDRVVLKKTLGVQACFDFLKVVVKNKGCDFNYSEVFFSNLLQGAGDIDFSDEFFGVQTKVRARIKNSLLVASGVKKVEELKCSNEDKVRISGLIAS
jgi:DNA phosphorothioation-associated DGQHR protein 1